MTQKTLQVSYVERYIDIYIYCIIIGIVVSKKHKFILYNNNSILVIITTIIVRVYIYIHV